MFDDEAIELQIGLHRRGSKALTIELRYVDESGETAIAEFPRAEPDLDRLRQEIYDPHSYGRHLSAFLFGDDVRLRFAEVRAAAAARNKPLRMRLYVGQSAPDLHDFHWESLRDPVDDTPLLTPQTYFSRYLSSNSWRTVTIAAKGTLRAIVAIANPTNLQQDYTYGAQLSPIDVAAELDRARTALGRVRMTTFASVPGAAHPRPTLENLLAALRSGCDILYLVCHGRLDAHGQPWLLLEDEEGKVGRASGAALAKGLGELHGQLPRLVVLASCQSAGSGAGVPDDADPPTVASEDHEGFIALGPQLAKARVAAVVAMQGNISMQTVAEFLPVFFGALKEDGRVDAAMAVARGAVAHRSDWWMPVLFSRLESGHLWYRPQLAKGFEQWDAFLNEIRRGRCIAILGPALSEALFGSRRELAWSWAKRYSFPMAPDARENLAQVAQYIAVNQQSRHLPHEELGDHLQDELRTRYGDQLPESLRQAAGGADLEALLTAVTAKLLEDESEPHRLLAGLPLPIYITSQQTNLMGPALQMADRPPEVDFCNWTDDVAWPPRLFDTKPDYEPTTATPLVFHLFGMLREPESLVLTEDDFFDYLLRVSRDPTALPDRLMRRVMASSLLFLGFGVDDWEFRVFHRILMNQQSLGRLSRRPHVAVQIAPEEGRFLNTGRARRYLESYFGFGDARIGVYWGTVEEFIGELTQRWDADQP